MSSKARQRRRERRAQDPEVQFRRELHELRGMSEKGAVDALDRAEYRFYQRGAINRAAEMSGLKAVVVVEGDPLRADLVLNPRHHPGSKVSWPQDKGAVDDE